MQFDGSFLWTDDANAEPPPTSDDSMTRRRRYIGGVARLILFALVIPWR